MKAYPTAKRAFDLVVGGLLLIGSAPVQCAVAVMIRCSMGSPVLFRQPRPGLNGRVFQLCKFRTMHDPNETLALDSDEQRLTRLGAFLRSTSLDELPTLWQVVVGDMSLVGPRPLLVQYMDRYTPEQARRHNVRPGITGLAQVSGRNAITWDERLARDIEYVDTQSLVLDLKILTKTILKVVQRHGISQAGQATMSEFLGDSAHGAHSTRDGDWG